MSKFASDPGMKHWQGLLDITAYLKGTRHLGLKYGGHNESGETGCIYGYCDASYGRCKDTRRSRHGGVMINNGGAVDWRSKMQSIVALSSMESEYIGASETSRHIMWLRGAMKNLGLGNETPTELGIDNKSAKMFAEEHMIQNRSKHIDTKYHYVREKIAEGEIKLFYQPTLHNPADIFTKPLSGVSFNRFRKMMGVVNVRR